MNTRVMAIEYGKRSRAYLKESRGAFSEGDYELAVERAEECARLGLKAALRCVAVELPRKREVNEAFDAVREKFPVWFSGKIPGLIKIAEELAENVTGREDGAVVRPAVGKETAEAALQKAERLFGDCKRVLYEAFGE